MAYGAAQTAAVSAVGGERESQAADPGRIPLARLYQSYFSKLVGDLRATFGRALADPEEIAQRAFERLNAHRDLDEIRNLQSFAWVCARNIALSEWRADQVRRSSQSAVEQQLERPSADPERVVMAREQLAVVMQTLRRMPERRRRIFMLTRVDGLTPAEAARQCGVSRTSAVRHIAVATATIAEALSCRSDPQNGVAPPK